MQDGQSSFQFAKTLWSWGRMDNILSEGRKIESRRQLKRAIAFRSKRNVKIWKRNKRTPVSNHIDAQAGVSEWTQSEARKVYEKETRYEGCGLRKREKTRGERDRHETFQGRVAARNKTG